jgi:hypothetical protein
MNIVFLIWLYRITIKLVSFLFLFWEETLIRINKCHDLLAIIYNYKINENFRSWSGYFI